MAATLDTAKRFLCRIGFHWDVTATYTSNSAPTVSDCECHLCGKKWVDLGW